MSHGPSLAALLACAAVVFGSAAAAQVPAPSRAALVALTQVADIESLALSPDGRRVAFRVQRPSVARNTYAIEWHVADLASGQVTAAGDGGTVIYDNGVIEVDAPVWAPDSRAFFRRALVDGAIGILRTAADGSGSEPVVFGDADVERIAPGPDGRSLIYWTGPTRAAIEAAERAEYDDGVLIDATVDTRQGLFRPAYSHGRLRTQRLTGYWYARDQLLWQAPRHRHRLDPVTLKSEPDGLEPARGEPLGATAGSLEVKSASGAVAKASWGSPSQGPSLEVRRADGLIIACSDPVCRTGSIDAIAWWPGRDEVLLTKRDAAFRQALYGFNPASGRVRRIAQGSGLRSGGRDWRAPCAVSERYAVCVDAAAAAPPRLVRIDLDTERREVLLDPNRELRGREAPQIEYLDVPGSDGRMASAILLTPRGRSERLPLFVMYYICPGYLRGGMGDEFPFGPMVDAGFVVACITYAPRQAGETAIEDYEQAQAIVENLVERLDRRKLVDTSRIGMGGLSFGSEVTMWMAMKTGLLAAAATASPQGSPSGFWQSAIRGRDTAEHYLRGWKAGNPDTDLEGWRRFSPELNVDKIKAPLLMQLPEQEIVSVLQFYARMTHSTTPVELYAYPHESHTKVQPRHRYAVYRRNLDWFRYWLQGYMDPDPAQTAQYRRWDELRARRSRSVKGS